MVRWRNFAKRGRLLRLLFPQPEPPFHRACLRGNALKPRRLANLFLHFLFVRKWSALRIGEGGNVGTLPQEMLFGRTQPANPAFAPRQLTRAHRMRTQLAGKRCVIGNYPHAEQIKLAERLFTREEALLLDDAIPRIASGGSPPWKALHSGCNSTTIQGQAFA